MSEDNELRVMTTVLPAMESLNADERKRVINWLIQKLAIGVTTPKATASSEVTFQQVGQSVSTDTIANAMNAKSGPDLIVAAAAQLHFVQGKQKFTRQDLVNEMRAAPGYFKETFVNNLSKYLVGLTRAERFRLVGQNTYALSNKERQAMETALANIG